MTKTQVFNCHKIGQLQTSHDGGGVFDRYRSHMAEFLDWIKDIIKSFLSIMCIVSNYILPSTTSSDFKKRHLIS